MWFALLNREPRAAGDGAEFADDQPVLVDRVVVQDVVLFELCRVVHEIVVDRVVADLDTGVVDHRIQIDRPAVVRAGICFRIHRVFRCAAFAGPPHFLQNCEKIPANRRSGDEIFPLQEFAAVSWQERSCAECGFRRQFLHRGSINRGYIFYICSRKSVLWNVQKVFSMRRCRRPPSDWRRSSRCCSPGGYSPFEALSYRWGVAALFPGALAVCSGRSFRLGRRELVTVFLLSLFSRRHVAEPYHRLSAYRQRRRIDHLFHVSARRGSRHDVFLPRERLCVGFRRYRHVRRRRGAALAGECRFHGGK